MSGQIQHVSNNRTVQVRCFAGTDSNAIPVRLAEGAFLPPPVEVLQTAAYDRWFAGLRDERAKGRILARIRRLSLGNFGDAKPVGGGVSELRADYGPGYRIYLARRGDALVLLLTGGDKSRQRADIARARELAAAWEGK